MRGPTARFVRLAAALVATATLWACAAPNFPVPPPGDVSFSKQVVTDNLGASKTVWITSRGADDKASSAVFYILDVTRETGVIAGAAANGSFSAPAMDGTAGDRVEIHYETPLGDISPTACVLLQEGASPPACQ
ncbi:MAG TPA: hypothetical protein VHJ20_12175 [Polyangia bacterium]|nr:hypothetical protein [Polyangia bacterium]